MARSKPTSTKRQREFDKRKKKKEKSERRKSRIEEAGAKDDEFIGRQVISLENGLGTIEGHNVENNVFTIGFQNSMLNLEAEKDGKVQFRFLSKKSEIQSNIELLKERELLQSIESPLERINFFQMALQSQNITLKFKAFGMLSLIKKQTEEEKKIFDVMLKTLAIEISSVLEIELKSSIKMLSHS